MSTSVIFVNDSHVSSLKMISTSLLKHIYQFIVNGYKLLCLDGRTDDIHLSQITFRDRHFRWFADHPLLPEKEEYI